MRSISETKEEGKQELSVEEIKRMRLCLCGCWKRIQYPCCFDCHLMLGSAEYSEVEHKNLLLDVASAIKDGNYQFLVEGKVGQQRQAILKKLKFGRVILSSEDFKSCEALIRTNRIARHQRINRERAFIGAVLNHENPTKVIGGGFSQAGHHSSRPTRKK